jgi:uncharacterized protein (TIGR01777 family)
MRIVIIGGRGLIGNAVCLEAKNRGHEVLILTRKRVEKQEVGLIQVAQWDGKDAECLAKLIESHDAIVNLAGESIGKSRWTTQRKDAILTSRIEPTKAIVAAMRIAIKRPRVLVQASAVGIYGVGDDELTETSGLGDDFPARLAMEWEDASSDVENLKVRRVLIRSGIVLDRHAGVLQQLMLPIKLFIGGRIGSGKQWYSWIHIRDEVKAILFLLENEQSSGIYNLTSPNPVSNRGISSELAKVMKRPFWFPIPGFVLKLILGEMSTLVLEGQRIIPKRLEEAGFIFEFPEIRSALEDLLK